MSTINTHELLSAIGHDSMSAGEISRKLSDHDSDEIEAELVKLERRQIVERDGGASSAKTDRWRLTPEVGRGRLAARLDA